MRNAERQIVGRQENVWRERARNEGRRFDRRDFRQAYYRHRDYRDNVLRSVISNLFIGNTGNYYYTPQYDPNYYASPYDPVYYSNDAYYGPQYSEVYEPIAYALPFSYGYYPGDSYISDHYGEDPYDLYGYSNELPLNYFTSSYAGNGYMSEMYGDLLAYGYEQGYEDGLYAREQRRRNVYYGDPYALENTVYDPYSFSLGENRRCLSEGYGIGYQDALSGNDDYDPEYGTGNGGDLVSMLISNVLELN